MRTFVLIEFSAYKWHKLEDVCLLCRQKTSTKKRKAISKGVAFFFDEELMHARKWLIWTSSKRNRNKPL